MVSGFFTSPYDHERIFSGEASPMRIASNSSSWVTCLNKSSSAFIQTSGLSIPAASIQLPAFGASRRPGRLRADRRLPTASITLEIDVDRERADFLHQHVERLRHAGIDLVLALDDVLVHLGAPAHVVRLHGQHLLQRVSSTVGFERPNLHFAEALAA